MSTPPPGGPSAPQPPPYPPYPPQSPYPQQYPPAQPYYPPPVPPHKDSNLVLIIVLVVVVVVIGLAVLAWYIVTTIVAPVQTFARVTVTDTSWTISGDTLDFVSSNLACGECPQTVFAGSQMSFTITLHNTDPVNPHGVTSITVGQPFTLWSTTPSLPYPVAATGQLTLTVTVEVASIGGSYVLSGVIYTS